MIVLVGSLFSVFLNVCFGVCVSVVVGAAFLVGFVIAYNAIAIFVN